MSLLTAEGVIRNARAAAEKPPFSTTRANTSISAVRLVSERDIVNLYHRCWSIRSSNSSRAAALCHRGRSDEPEIIMEYRRLGSSDLKVPALSFGAGTFGGSGPL